MLFPQFIPFSSSLVCYSVSFISHLDSDAQSLSCVRIFATPWTEASPGSSVRWTVQARTLEKGMLDSDVVFQSVGCLGPFI